MQVPIALINWDVLDRFTAAILHYSEQVRAFFGPVGNDSDGAADALLPLIDGTHS